MMRVLSLGAGRQSSTLALMSRDGDLPLLDAAIFADTGAEPGAVYRHLDWLESVLPFPVYRVSSGDLRKEIISSMRGEGRSDGHPPFFTGKGGMVRRQCTEDYKIRPINRKIRELIGLERGKHGPKEPVVEQWIGISLDEALRMKPSRFSYVRHAWPLIDKRMSVWDCVEWLKVRDYPVPVKSACVFCPFRHDNEWRQLRRCSADWSAAVEVDEAIRHGIPGPRRPEGESWFVHASRRPLVEVDLSTPEDHGQLNLFMNECEGLCGV